MQMESSKFDLADRRIVRIIQLAGRNRFQQRTVGTYVETRTLEHAAWRGHRDHICSEETWALFLRQCL